MSYLTEKRLYYVNSEDRIQDTTSNNSDFDYKFEIPEKKFDSCVCMDLSIPKSYELVQDGQNTFTLQEDNKNAIITVSAGNYGTTSFCKYIINEINTSSPNGWTYSIIVNQQGKFEFKVKNNTSQPSIVVTTFLYEQLGFKKNTTNTFVNNELTSVNVIDFTRESTLFLRSDIVTQGNGDNVLQQVFTDNVNDFSYIVFNCPDVLAYAKPFNSTSNNIYHFWVTNERGDKIDTKKNIVFTLMLFKRSTVFDNLNNFMKYLGDFIESYKKKQ